MGLLDTLLGRTKPVRANLDNLFALPGAAVTLQVSCGLVSTRKAGVCFKPPAGQPFAEMQSQIDQLLQTPDADSAASAGAQSGPTSSAAAGLEVRHAADSFGYRWILVEGGEIEDLVTRVHMVHSSFEEGGWSTQLLCSVFEFGPGPDAAATGAGVALDPSAPAPDTVSTSGPVYLVYLAKRGTFYPFAPTGKEKRDTELELRLRSVVGTDLPVDSDLSHWFPIWDIPLA